MRGRCDSRAGARLPGRHGGDRRQRRTLAVGAVQERDGRAARSAHRPGGLGRQGAAALGAVRRLPEQQDEGRHEDQPGAVRHAARRRAGREPGAQGRSEQPRAGRRRPGRQRRGHRGRRHLRPEPPRLRLRLCDPDGAHHRRRQGAHLLPDGRHRLRAEHDRRRLHPQAGSTQPASGSSTTRRITASRSPTASSACCGRPASR